MSNSYTIDTHLNSLSITNPIIVLKDHQSHLILYLYKSYIV